MDENTIIEELEELIKSFGIQIRHEIIKQDEDSLNVVGGLCLLKGKYVLIINSKPTIRDKIRTLGMALKQFGHDQIYMRPFLRELLDRIPEQSPFKQEREGLTEKLIPEISKPLLHARILLFQEGGGGNLVKNPCLILKQRRIE